MLTLQLELCHSCEEYRKAKFIACDLSVDNSLMEVNVTILHYINEQSLLKQII